MAIKEFRNIEEYAQPMPRMPMNMYPMGQVPDIGDQVSDHMKRHWLKYLLGGAVISRPSFKARSRMETSRKAMNSLGEIYKNHSYNKQVNLDRHRQLQNAIDSLDNQRAQIFIKANPKLKLKNMKDVKKFLMGQQQELLNQNKDIDAKIADLTPKLQDSISKYNSDKSDLGKRWFGNWMGGNDPDAQLSHFQAPDNTGMPSGNADYNLQFTDNPQPDQQSTAGQVLGDSSAGPNVTATGATPTKYNAMQHYQDLMTKMQNGQALSDKEEDWVKWATNHKDEFNKFHNATQTLQTTRYDQIPQETRNYLDSIGFKLSNATSMDHIYDTSTGQLRDQQKSNDPKVAADIAMGQFAGKGMQAEQAEKEANQDAAEKKAAAPDASENAVAAAGAQPEQTTQQPSTAGTQPNQTTSQPSLSDIMRTNNSRMTKASGELTGKGYSSRAGMGGKQPFTPQQKAGGVIGDSNININDLVGKYLFMDNEDESEDEDYEYHGSDGNESYSPKKRPSIGRHLGKILAVGGALGAAALGAGAIHGMANAHERNAHAFRELGDVNKAREHYARSNVLRSIDLIHKGKQAFSSPEE